MKLSPKSTRRPGFTLVEMLVVLAIVIILMSLIAGAVLQFTRVGPQVQAQYELSHLNQAMESFKQKTGMYPPSKVFLANCVSDYQAAYLYYSNLRPPDTYNMAVINNSWAVTANSTNLLQRIFPKLVLPASPPPTQAQSTFDWTGGQVQSWTGNNPNNRWKGTFLEGDQCLVFFLGGIQVLSQPGNVPTCIGFATDARNPTSLSNAANNYAPLYEFPSTRLKTVTRNYPAPYNQNPFVVFKDPFGADVPYIYYSSYGTRNGYLPPDCASQVGPSSLQTMSPYYEATSPIRVYLNPNTFQIISAGPDGDFGPGGYWNPGLNPVDPYTKDNQSNFNNGGLMGTRN
jgi:prepilin-type N-terminal cleavage/methylation domain-containing protein